MDVTAPAILEIGLVLILAALAGWLARRLGVPAVVGYLAFGLAVSPFTPGPVANREQLQLFADVGVVLLLFEVGIEVNLGRLRREQGSLLWAAPVQVAVTTLVTASVLIVAGLSWEAAALMGLAIAMSSSVVVVNITRSRRRTTDPLTERLMLGWSVIQDVVGVFAALLVLAVLGAGERPVPLAILGVVGYAGLVVVSAWLLPRLLARVHEQRDLFLVLTVGSGLALAGAGSLVFGVPLALAAFLAGLAITESQEAAEARRRLLPLRDVFALLFFVAIGTLIDPMRLGDALPWLGLLVTVLAVGKALVVFVLGRLARMAASPLQLSIGLGQVGEFSFVLASVLLARDVLPVGLYTATLAAVALSIVASTVGVRLIRAPGSRALADA